MVVVELGLELTNEEDTDLGFGIGKIDCRCLVALKF